MDDQVFMLLAQKGAQISDRWSGRWSDVPLTINWHLRKPDEGENGRLCAGLVAFAPRSQHQSLAGATDSYNTIFR